MTDPSIANTTYTDGSSRTHGTLAGLLRQFLENQIAQTKAQSDPSKQGWRAEDGPFDRWFRAIQADAMATAYNNALMALNNISHPDALVMHEINFDAFQKLEPVIGTPTLYAVWPSVA